MQVSKSIILLLFLVNINSFAQDKGELLGKSMRCAQLKEYQCLEDNLAKIIPLEKNKKKLSLYHNNLGIAQLNNGKFNEAVLSFNKSIEYNNKFYLPYYGRAKTNEFLKRENIIASDLMKFLEIYEKEKITRHYDEKIYALVFLNKKDDLEKELIQANTDSEKMKIEIALIRIKKKQKLYEEAISDYLKLVEKYPNNHIVYNNLADTYLLNGEFSEGLNIVEKAIELNPKDKTSNMTKAELLMSQNKKQEACQFLSRSLELGFNKNLIPDLMKPCTID